MVRNLKKIALNYVKGYFIIELLSFLPSLVTGEQVEWVYYFKVLRFFHVERMFKQLD